MRTPSLILIAIAAAALLCPSAVAAQGAVADGVRALAAGDTITATRILTPLATGANPDPVAQFFLGALAEATDDPIRACGWYQRSAERPHPFSPQATALSTAMRQWSAAMAMLCDRSRDGAWVEPEPIAFELAPGHWVYTDASGFSVVYGGTTRRTPDKWGGPGRVYLPTRYTRMTIAEPVSKTRHFIEYWYWEPEELGAPTTTWWLVWVVYEVVGADVKQVAMSGAGTVSASRPPADFRLDAAGRLQINAAGEVERIVLGSQARTDVIPDGGTR